MKVLSSRWKHIAIVAVACVALFQTTTRAADDTAAQAQASLDKALDFLKSQQKPDGGWQEGQQPPAFTALPLRAFAQDPHYDASKDEFLKKGYAKLTSYQVESGAVYKDMLANYNTAIAVSALAAGANEDPSLKPSLDKALAYLKSMQWTEKTLGPKGESIKDDDKKAWEGGFGYNRHGRPDLSNAQFSISALHDAGLKPDDPAFKEAIKFLSRTQNFSETNDQPWSSNDGGFVYSPANGGDSEAESYVGPDGRKMWRSYGTMTYAGLKSMIYAGLSKDDPRVKAAHDWIRGHWTLDENPGMADNDPKQAQHGLYYYYNVMARALNAYDDPMIMDTKDVEHDWRKELVAKIASLQKPDGSFVGEKRWMEDNPVLTTSYIALALEEIQADLKEHPAK